MQDDIMYCNMTVEENLLFSARYRLPTYYTNAQHIYYVERAIQVPCLFAANACCLPHCIAVNTQVHEACM